MGACLLLSCWTTLKLGIHLRKGFIVMKVLFIVPDTFLRTVEKTDPFYDPIMRVIDETPEMEWRILLPRKGMTCGYPQEKIGNYKWFQWCSIWFYRFWRLLNRKTPVWKINYCFGKLTRPLFKKKFDADIIITQAGIFSAELAGMFPNKRIVDVQHGVIYSTHDGYFTPDARLVEQYQFTKNREFLVYGKGYADCFFKHPDNARDLEGRVHVIGDVVNHQLGEIGDVKERLLVVISGQIVDDNTDAECVSMIKTLKDFLVEFFKDNEFSSKYQCVFKHHPRFNNVCDMTWLREEFPKVAIDASPWGELYEKIALHVTVSSTTALDCASNGIVTYFLTSPPDVRFVNNLYWKTDYGYPFYEYSWKELLLRHTELSDVAKAWFKNFYTPFSKKMCKELLVEKNKS